MTVEEEHTNRVGTLHGGYTATIVDMITSMALYTNKQAAMGVSVDMHISYVIFQLPVKYYVKTDDVTHQSD